MKKLTNKLIAILLAVMCIILSVTAASAATTRRPEIQEMSVTLNGHTADRCANFTSSERVPVVICAKTKGTGSSELTWRWTNYNNNAEIVQLDNKHLMVQLSRPGCVTGVVFTKNGKSAKFNVYYNGKLTKETADAENQFTYKYQDFWNFLTYEFYDFRTYGNIITFNKDDMVDDNRLGSITLWPQPQRNLKPEAAKVSRLISDFWDYTETFTNTDIPGWLPSDHTVALGIDWDYNKSDFHAYDVDTDENLPYESFVDKYLFYYDDNPTGRASMFCIRFIPEYIETPQI